MVVKKPEGNILVGCLWLRPLSFRPEQTGSFRVRPSVDRGVHMCTLLVFRVEGFVDSDPCSDSPNH